MIQKRPDRVKPRLLLGLKDDLGRTALHYACLGTIGRSDTAIALLTTGAADCDAIDGEKTKLTPLHLAAMQGDLALTEALLSADPPPTIDVQDSQGRTPLICATQEGYVEVASALLQARASIELADNGGSTASEWATLLEHEDIVALLKPQ